MGLRRFIRASATAWQLILPNHLEYQLEQTNCRQLPKISSSTMKEVKLLMETKGRRRQSILVIVRI